MYDYKNMDRWFDRDIYMVRDIWIDKPVENERTIKEWRKESDYKKLYEWLCAIAGDNFDDCDHEEWFNQRKEWIQPWDIWDWTDQLYGIDDSSYTGTENYFFLSDDRLDQRYHRGIYADINKIFFDKFGIKMEEL